MSDATMPDATAFEAEIRERWREGEEMGADFVDVQAADVHRSVGGYPDANHRMPMCYAAMRRTMVAGDEVLAEPPRGSGATLMIRYRLPRLRDYSTERA
jgi:hypothetical protein